MFAHIRALQVQMTDRALMTHLKVYGLLAVAEFSAQGSMGRYLRDVGSRIICQLVSTLLCAAQAWPPWWGLCRRFRRCRSTIIVSILETGSGGGANMHAALGQSFTSQSCARFAPGAAH